MVEVRIHGRGGQGGVTLAKLLATARFLQGDSVQAFGLYAAERSGAPVQAFCRWSPDPVTNRNLIYHPDHVVVLDPTLIGPSITAGLKAGGWVLLNTPEAPRGFGARFPEASLATVDATGIARDNGLGTRSVPIVNTALAGAMGRLLGLPLEEMEAAFHHLGFGGGNVTAARQAYEAVSMAPWAAVTAGGAGAPETAPEEEAYARPLAPSFLEGAGGDLPAIRTGAWASEQPHRQQHVPPCNHVCPAGNDVQAFLHALAEERVDDALAVLLETTPFPSVCGRVCPAPCMESCNRTSLEGAVNVRQLERYAGDHGRVKVRPLEVHNQRVAIVGSGPAGLTAAYHLGRLGYPVAVYDGADEVGGLLRSGIPGFRLPTDVLERELERIASLGVTFVTDARIDRPGLLRLGAEYDAVLVATGLQQLAELRLGLGDAPGVEQGIVFLDRVHRGEARVAGEDVVVVGGGNTAMDAARSALRLGAARVRVVYRRTRSEMPAIAEEVDEALEEGVVIDFLTQPVAARSPAQTNGGESSLVLVCRRMELGPPDESGRRRPVPVEGSDFELSCHRLILALGQSPDLSIFPEGTEVREDAQLLGMLERPIFAVGDLANNEGTVAAAIGSGRRAAYHLHGALSGRPFRPAPIPRRRRDVEVFSREVIRADDMRLYLFEAMAEQEGPTLPMGRRRSGFDEVHAGLSDPSEAKRCLSCGVCNDCDLCLTYCPEGVLTRAGPDLVFDYDYCKGCGVCVAECPRDVIFMSHL